MGPLGHHEQMRGSLHDERGELPARSGKQDFHFNVLSLRERLRQDEGVSSGHVHTTGGNPQDPAAKYLRGI